MKVSERTSDLFFGMAMGCLLGGTFSAIGVDIYHDIYHTESETQTSKSDGTEASAFEYELVLKYYEQIPLMRGSIKKAMADGKLTWAEFTEIHGEQNQYNKFVAHTTLLKYLQKEAMQETGINQDK